MYRQNTFKGFPGGAEVKNLPTNAGDLGSFPGSGRSTGEGNGNPLQHSCLEKSHEQGSLASYSPWNCEESDTTEHMHTQLDLNIRMVSPSLKFFLTYWTFLKVLLRLIVLPWMVSLTQWTWVWINSGSWWWTGRPGMLQSMGLQTVGHDWVTELNC